MFTKKNSTKKSGVKFSTIMKWLVVIGFMYYAYSSAPQGVHVKPGELIMSALGLYIGVNVAWFVIRRALHITIADMKRPTRLNFGGGSYSYSSRSNSSAYDERRMRKEMADQAARNRYNARNRQKIAEWDARDLALRGSAKGAAYYSNQANYWRNEAQRY